MDRHLYLYVDTAGEVALAGELWTRDRHGKESATFRDAPAWLTSAGRFALGPDLPLGETPLHASRGMNSWISCASTVPSRWRTCTRLG